ncbi:MAG: FAD-dependent oxidoreductase, partial [Candidatus Neomarinimicrobiota bacterium]
KGEPVRDFVIRHEADKGLPGFINLVGIDSPALTACAAIAEEVAEIFRNL